MSAVLGAVAAALGADVAHAQPIGGGDINAALHVVLADGRELFVKHRDGAPADWYRAEAAGLAWLAEAGAVRIPTVAAVGDAATPFLALEWIAPGIPAPDHDERLGRGLAALHRAGAPGFGLDGDNYIGSLPQPNAPAPSWAEFYGQRRIAPLARRAIDDGALPARLGTSLERLLGRLEDLCGPAEPPARLHGDLWAGNRISGPSGEPVLIDPAVYGGHREIDLAMMRLFGGYREPVFAAYEEEFPLAPGASERTPLYQLYPLLVHVVLFGGGYATSAARVLRRYGGSV